MSCAHLRQYLPGTQQTLPCASKTCPEGTTGGSLRTVFTDKATGKTFDQRWGRLKVDTGSGVIVYLWANEDAQIAPEVAGGGA